MPQAKGGETTVENLCYACPRCNLRKKDAVIVVDPLTTMAVTLFHPRQQLWDDHFGWSVDRLEILGKPNVGRATIARLPLNDAVLRRARVDWLALKLIP